MVVEKHKKAHSKTVADAWAKFGMKVWLDVGKVKDQTLIDECTFEDAEDLGGSPVNPLDCMIPCHNRNASACNCIRFSNDDCP